MPKMTMAKAEKIWRDSDIRAAQLKSRTMQEDARLLTSIYEASEMLSLVRRLAPDTWGATVEKTCGGNHQLADLLLAAESTEPRILTEEFKRLSGFA